MGERVAWDIRPRESVKAFAAFKVYMGLDLNAADPSRRRTQVNTARILGKSISGIELWSSKFDWVNRAALYDASLHELTLEVRRADLTQLQSFVRDTTMMQLLRMTKLIENQLRDLETADEVSPIDVKRTVEALRINTDLMYRAAQLATNYTSERAVSEDEGQTFLLGSDDG